MSIRNHTNANNLQQPKKGCVVVKIKKQIPEIKVNLHFNAKGETLQKIIEKNVLDLNRRLS